jgi:CheY-like chemotaxis protein
VHLLVCDDDPSIGKLLQSVYKVDGWQVDVVTSGQACIDMVAESPPDVIVLDHMMPEMTGVETARTLRSRKYTNPIVLFSGYIGPDLDEAIKNLDLMPVSKIDTQTIIRIIDVLGSRPHLGTKTLT